MSDETELLELERAGWDALSRGAGAAAAFYGRVLSDDPVFLFPGGLVLDDRTAIIESMSGPAWDDYALSDERVLPITPEAAVVVYRAEGRRGADRYTALCSSTYGRSGGQWRLRMHQQTPV